MREPVALVLVTAAVVLVLVFDDTRSSGWALLATVGIIVGAALVMRGWGRFLSRRPCGVAEFNRSRSALARRHIR